MVEANSVKVRFAANALPRTLLETVMHLAWPEEWVKYCGWGAAFVKRKDFGGVSAAWPII